MELVEGSSCVIWSGKGGLRGGGFIVCSRKVVTGEEGSSRR